MVIIRDLFERNHGVGFSHSLKSQKSFLTLIRMLEKLFLFKFTQRVFQSKYFFHLPLSTLILIDLHTTHFGIYDCFFIGAHTTGGTHREHIFLTLIQLAKALVAQRWEEYIEEFADRCENETVYNSFRVL